jgi:HPt (histidine-containing phosphotransfer) domain-containing protein
MTALAPSAVLDAGVFDELSELARTVDDGFLAEVVEQFVGETTPLLAELDDAVDFGDSVAVRRIAHSLKGSSGQMGGARMAVACDGLEGMAAGGDARYRRAALREIHIDHRALCRALGRELRLAS